MLRLLPDGTLVPILRGKHRVKLVVELQDTFASLGFNLREREKPGLKSQLKGPDAVLYVERLAHSDVFGHSVRGFRTPRGAVGGREATDVCVSR